MAQSIKWQEAPDVYLDLKNIIKKLNLSYIPLNRIKTFRSFASNSQAKARIWGFPRIWQKALSLPPYYIIEVLSEKYDKLSKTDQKKVLIHELMHIPKNFSGSLLAHKSRYHRINSQTVEKLFKKL